MIEPNTAMALVAITGAVVAGCSLFAAASALMNINRTLAESNRRLEATQRMLNARLGQTCELLAKGNATLEDNVEKLHILSDYNITTMRGSVLVEVAEKNHHG